MREHSFRYQGPVHTNPLSNKNRAVLLRFQKDLHPHLSFSYRFRPSTLQQQSREKPLFSVCLPFWILTVEWSGIWCVYFRCHRFQMALFSLCTLEHSIFQIVPLWRVFSNGSVVSDHFWHCSVDDSRIQSKTALFSFENGLAWTGPKYGREN